MTSREDTRSGATPPVVLVVSTDETCLGAAGRWTDETIEWRQCSTLDAAVRELDARSFDVVVVDLALERGARAIAELFDAQPSIALVAVADDPSAESAFAIARQGVQELLHRTEVAEVTLAQAVRRAASHRAPNRERELATRAMQMDRMVSIGLLAGGLGHEINTPLSLVTANVDLALRTVVELEAALTATSSHLTDPVGELREALTEARQGARRVRSIAEQLRTFSEPDGSDAGCLDLEPVIQAAVGISWNEIRHRARLIRDIKGPLAVAGNESRLGQVLLSLLTNAAHAIEPGHANENRVTIRAERAGDRVLLEISDTGSGIPDTVRGRIFEPFFTTDPTGRHSGLGLSLCRAVVTDMGGEISLESGPEGRGTTARVTLPAAELSRARPSTISPLAMDDESLRVLVVDDEPLIGRVVTRCLGRAHEVTAVCSGVEALALVDNGARFDVVFLDVMMPEMTGLELYRALQQRAPTLVSRIVFLTGGAFAPAARAALDALPNTRITKPFEPRQIREAARAVAHRAEPAHAG